MSKTLLVSNGDWAVDSRGRFSWISDRHKCAQDAANFLLQDLTEDGSQGSELGKIERSAIVDAVNAHRALISTLVSEAIDRLIVLQDLDEEITDEEKIANFTVTVERISRQQMSYAYLLAIETEAADEPIEVPFVVELEHVRDPELEQ